MDLSPLFDRVQVGSIELRNRIAHPAVLGNYGAAGLPTDKQIAYYEARAQGGAGLIVTEGVSVHPSSQPNPSIVHAYDPMARDGLTRLAGAVHRHGARVLLQLWHVGRQQLSRWQTATMGPARGSMGYLDASGRAERNRSARHDPLGAR